MTNDEIGGYFEFESFHGKHYHDKLIKVDSGRSALLYLIKLRKIKSMYIPDYMCDVIRKTCENNNVGVQIYKISNNFFPKLDFNIIKKNDWIFLADYYGQLENSTIKKISKRVNGKVIVDECQNFFKKPLKNIDTIYTCRKYFGVADGGYVYTKDNNQLKYNLKQAKSLHNMQHVIGRYEENASKYFKYAQENNNRFDFCTIYKMSKTTDNILKAINYKNIIKRRNKNFSYLNSHLKKYNKLSLKRPNGPFMYPLLLDNKNNFKEFLANKSIYIPTLWPNVLNETDKSDIAYYYAKNIYPLPIDQRYNKDDMEILLKEVKKCIK